MRVNIKSRTAAVCRCAVGGRRGCIEVLPCLKPRRKPCVCWSVGLRCRGAGEEGTYSAWMITPRTVM